MTAQERWREASQGATRLYQALDVGGYNCGWLLTSASNRFAAAGIDGLAAACMELAEAVDATPDEIRTLIDLAAIRCGELERETLADVSDQ